MGRDLITRTEKFKQPTDLLKAMVQQAEKEVLETSSGEDEKPDNRTIERSHQVQEFEETRYEASVSPESKENNVERLRQNIHEMMSKCSATSPLEFQRESLRLSEFKINLIDPNQGAIRCKSRPLAESIKDTIKQELKDQEKAGLIRRSKSEWAAPLHVVKKPDGTPRLTVDYTALNKVIKFDPYPIPNTRDIFNKLAKSKYFSKFDFLKAYHQIPTADDSVKYTSFVCEFGQFEYPTMPMGIKTAAAWFQRVVDGVLQNMIDEGKVAAYMDDTILHSETPFFYLSSTIDIKNK